MPIHTRSDSGLLQTPVSRGRSRQGPAPNPTQKTEITFITGRRLLLRGKLGQIWLLTKYIGVTKPGLCASNYEAEIYVIAL